MRVHRVNSDVSVLNGVAEVPGLGFLPVNAFVLRAEQPFVVDTGLGKQCDRTRPGWAREGRNAKNRYPRRITATRAR